MSEPCRNSELYPRKRSGFTITTCICDWLKLTVTGFLKGEETESVEYYLADFRGEKVDENGVPEPDSLLTKWKNLSLTKLGQVDNIDFTLESSKGDNMMAEPMTFCLDHKGI